jgi:Nitroreductase family
VRRLLGAAAAAPSIHNTQPWRFRIAGHDLVEVHGDPDRMLWVADPRGRALYLSCGAALLNLRLAIRASGAKPLVWPLPDPAGEPTLLASVQLAEGRPPDSAERELPHLAVLATAHDEPADWLRAGQALQRVLLTATVYGVTASLLYQPIELHDTRQPEAGWWPWPECPQIVIRFGYGPPGSGTPRRPVEDILDRPAAAGDGWPASGR